jgi:hypothetical protein
MPAAVTIREAARELQVSVRCIQHWIRAGAPTDTLGGPGRSRGSTVRVADLRRWRSACGAHARLTLDTLDAAIGAAFHRAPDGYERPAWQELGLSRRQAAAMLLETFREIHLAAFGTVPSDHLPANCERLFRIGAGLS